jgi:hypothetical protein
MDKAQTQEALRAVALIHENARHAPADLTVSVAYRFFCEDILSQYAHLLEARGISFTFTDTDPYQSSADMRADLAEGKLRVYTLADLPSDHPLAQQTPFGQSYNVLFRAVHDVYGHGDTGSGFGPMGELAAFREHAKRFRALSISALAAETLAQSAWVNFGPHNPEKLPPSERPYAEQKAYAFPISEALRFL